MPISPSVLSPCQLNVKSMSSSNQINIHNVTICLNYLITILPNSNTTLFHFKYLNKNRTQLFGRFTVNN